VAVPTYAVALSAEKRGGVKTIWNPLSSVGSSVVNAGCRWPRPSRAAARLPKFGRSPATTRLPSGLTLGWSMIEPSKYVQRLSPPGLTASR
jgi:hypothetical protein